jgi:hypothetical protein
MMNLTEPSPAESMQASNNQHGEQKIIEKSSAESTMSTIHGDKGVLNAATELTGETGPESTMSSKKSNDGDHNGSEGLVESDVLEAGQRTFTLFPKLPAELRLRVWKYSLPGPQYIEVQMSLSSFIQYPQWKFVSQDKAPAAFFVCHESRAEATKNYKLLRGTQSGTPAIYCDAAIDVLVFRNYRNCAIGFNYSLCLQQLPNDFVANIKHIALECWGYDSNTSLSYANPFYVLLVDHFFRQEDVDKLSSLETVEISDGTAHIEGKVVGFTEEIETSSIRQLFCEDVRERIIWDISHIENDSEGEGEGEEADPVRAAPRVKLGKLILKE